MSNPYFPNTSLGSVFTLSNAVEHERGWVATKIGFSDMFVQATKIRYRWNNWEIFEIGTGTRIYEVKSMPDREPIALSSPIHNRQVSLKVGKVRH